MRPEVTLATGPGTSKRTGPGPTVSGKRQMSSLRPLLLVEVVEIIISVVNLRTPRGLAPRNFTVAVQCHELRWSDRYLQR